MVRQGGKDSSDAGGATVETEDPCWQNMLDDDCQMSNIYSSSFIAADWIKSMPCGEGIAVSSRLDEKISPFLVVVAAVWVTHQFHVPGL